MAVVQVRVPDKTKAIWEAAARQTGLSISEFVRRSVNTGINDSGPRAIARRVADLLAPELERMLAAGASPATVAPFVNGPVPFVPATTFDRGCFDADLHRPGTACETCGGSVHA